jgi:Domain of unknown function (DUF4340)
MVETSMKLKSSTIVLMAIALLCAGGIYLWDRTHTAQDSASDAKKAAKSLFELKETDITQLTIESKQPTLKLEKAEKGWQLAAPKPGPANEGTVTFLLNLLATGTSEQTLQVDPAQLQEFGLDRPTATLSFQLKSQKTHRLILGRQNFNQSAVYAQVDPEPSAKKNSVVLVPTGFLDAINRPLSEWQFKASSPKPTPSPKPSP